MYSSNSPKASQHTTSYGPMSLLEAIKSHKGPCIGAALTIPSVLTAQLAGLSGCDLVMIDMEHSPLSAEAVTHMVHAVVSTSRGACFPLIRVPSHGVEWIKWALDSGAAGILVPMVHNAAEAERIIDKAVYPPVGRRSFGPLLAPFGNPQGPSSGVPGYLDRVDREGVLIIPMIESREGVTNAEEILRVEGVAGVFIGPYDLRLSMGLPGGMDGSEPEFVRALRSISSVAKRHGKIVGTMGIGEQVARKRAADGMDFLLSTVDYGAVAAGFAKDLKEARGGAEEGSEEGIFTSQLL